MYVTFANEDVLLVELPDHKKYYTAMEKTDLVANSNNTKKKTNMTIFVNTKLGTGNPIVERTGSLAVISNSPLRYIYGRLSY